MGDKLITIIDYGLGNLRSVSKALETVGAKIELTNNPKKISQAKAIILPGVGAFYRGMENLKRLAILSALVDAVQNGIPFLGICLGLQLLFSESEEHGICQGLNIVPGKVKKITGDVKIPHMGWNQVKLKIKNEKLKIFEGISDESYFYFVHSYYVEPTDKNVIISTTEYGSEFVSAVHQDNVWGVQFHPEKSAKIGLRLLENFYNYVK